jgi:hypothetical protein
MGKDISRKAAFDRSQSVRYSDMTAEAHLPRRTHELVQDGKDGPHFVVHFSEEIL